MPAAVVTRWNSTYRQLHSVTKLQFQKLIEIFGSEFPEAAITMRKWSQIVELCDVLGPFNEATDLTQGRC